ncbi:MAG: gamma carbonic anhydrase family protein [Atribacterota bacterium]|jgi:carbonic anhydrase/acetyltransferase-like protein (isoleucine patch superfamily)|nr:gamma carbonic anhydrase family protein [Atribacterota bacterium]
MIVKFRNKSPLIDSTALVVENATLVGEVYIGKYSSVWFSAVLRGDIESISIGDYTSVQDGSVIHVAENLPTKIGNYVTIGHGAILEGCTVEDFSLIGIGATILNEVVIGKNSIIAAGTVVTPRTIIPAYSMVMGIPGKVVRQIGEEESSYLKEHAEGYVRLMKEYKK